MTHILPDGATEIFEGTLWKVPQEEKDSREDQSIGSWQDGAYVDYDTWRTIKEYDGKNYLNAVLNYEIDVDPEKLLKIATHCIESRDALVSLGFSITHGGFDGDVCYEVGGKKMVPFETLKEELERLKESVLVPYQKFYDELGKEKEEDSGQ